jgi:hypothetical protein
MLSWLFSWWLRPKVPADVGRRADELLTEWRAGPLSRILDAIDTTVPVGDFEIQVYWSEGKPWLTDISVDFNWVPKPGFPAASMWIMADNRNFDYVKFWNGTYAQGLEGLDPEGREPDYEKARQKLLREPCHGEDTAQSILHVADPRDPKDVALIRKSLDCDIFTVRYAAIGALSWIESVSTEQLTEWGSADPPRPGVARFERNSTWTTPG